MREASWQQPCLTQQPFYEGSNIQRVGLMVADKQQGPVQWNGATALLHLPILSCG